MINRSDYPVLQGISRSADGAVLTLDTLEQVIERHHIVNSPKRKPSLMLKAGEYVVSVRGARRGFIGRITGIGSCPASTFVKFNGVPVEKAVENLRPATDPEILAARLRYGL
jgi:hypothetical protein